MVTADKPIKGVNEVVDAPIDDETDDNFVPSTVDDLKRLKAEEARKKREEHLRNKLTAIKQEEEKYSKFNQYKIKNNWLKLLRQSKVEELKQTIEIAAQDHDRQVDRKDAVIQMLYRDLDEAEEQYRLALRTHLQHIDELLELQNKRVQALQEEFNNDLYVLKTEFTEERMEIEERHKEELLECAEIQKEMDKRAAKIDQEMEEEQMRLKEAIKGQYSEDFTMMEGRMKGIIEKYRSLSRLDNRNFVEEMGTIHTDYIALNKKDDDETEKIKTKTLKIKALEENLANWKAKWLNNLREYEERNKQLTYEKDQLNLHFKELKKRMTRFREQERRRLAELIKMAHNTKDLLGEKLQKANRILQLAELNRKFETEREKILPFESDLDTLPENAANGVEFNEEHDLVEDEVMEQLHPEITYDITNQNEWELLSRFYKKYNKVLLDKMALQQEKDHLVDQNQKLRQMLKMYLDGISVNEDVLSKRNPLLIIENVDPTKNAQEQPLEIITTRSGAKMNRIPINN